LYIFGELNTSFGVFLFRPINIFFSVILLYYAKTGTCLFYYDIPELKKYRCHCEQLNETEYEITYDYISALPVCQTFQTKKAIKNANHINRFFRFNAFA
jgi:hypothetical protein